MKWTDFALRLRGLVFRSRAESDLDEELQFHLEMEARKHLAAGLDPSQAKLQAKIVFGGTEQVKEQCRDVRGTRLVENLFQDLRFGLRVLRKDRGYAVAAISALAVGIGSNVALFTLFSAVALKPLPVPDPMGLISISRATSQVPRGGIFSFADYIYYRDHSTSFAAIAAETPGHLRLAVASSGSTNRIGVAEPVMGLFVTANYFATFGVRPIVGRDFLAGEDRLIAGPYPALISDNYWQRRFGRDPAVLGRIFILSGFPARVVGITPKDFMGTRPETPDVWVIASAFGDPQRRELDRTNLCCALTARLKPGTSLRQAQADLSALADSLRREYPETERRFRVSARPATRFGGLKDNFIVLFSILQVAMGLVLLIACSNVAGLLLGRAVARQREIAVRLAVGASRNRLMRQLLTEGVLLSTIAGALAFLVAWQTLVALGRTVSGALAASGGAMAIDFNPDLRVYSYSFAISVLAGLFFALAPALQSTRPDLVIALKEESTGFAGGGKGWMRGWIVAAQIALCLTLLIGAGLLTSSSVRLLSVDPGFDTRDVLTLRMPSPQELGYTDGRARDLQIRLYQRIRASPGVVSVAFASRIPLGGNLTTTRIAALNGSSVQTSGEQRFPYTYVSPQYFQTLAIPLVAGRTFDVRDTVAGASVAVVSEALARRFWPGDDAVGKRIGVGSPAETQFFSRGTTYSPSTEIIGIVRDVYSGNLSSPDGGAVYLPKSRDEWSSIVLVRVAADPDQVAGALAAEVRAAEPWMPVSTETMRHMIATGEVSAVYRVGAMIFAVIGIIGFALASVGVYSMVAYSVSRKTREVGIRMALGARRADVVRLLLAGSLKWIAAGSVAGAVLGSVLSRVLASQLLLEGQKALDSAVVAAVSLLTAAVATLAAYFPARRASALDPAVTLRSE